MTKKRKAASLSDSAKQDYLDLAHDTSTCEPSWKLERLFRRLEAAEKKKTASLDAETERVVSTYISALLAGMSTANALALCLAYRPVVLSLSRGDAHTHWLTKLFRRWREEMKTSDSILRLILSQPEEVVTFLSELLKGTHVCMHGDTDKDVNDLPEYKDANVKPRGKKARTVTPEASSADVGDSSNGIDSSRVEMQDDLNILMSQVLHSVSSDAVIPTQMLLSVSSILFQCLSRGLMYRHASTDKVLHSAFGALRQIVENLLTSSVLQKLLRSDENDGNLLRLFQTCYENSNPNQADFFSIAAEIFSTIITHVQTQNTEASTALINGLINLGKGVSLLLKFNHKDQLIWTTNVWHSMLRQGLASSLRSLFTEMKDFSAMIVENLQRMSASDSSDDIAQCCLSAIVCLWDIDPSHGESLLRIAYPFFISPTRLEACVSFWSAAIAWASALHDCDVVWSLLPIDNLDAKIFTAPRLLATWRLAGKNMLPGEAQRLAGLINQTLATRIEDSSSKESAASLLAMAVSLLESVQARCVDAPLLASLTTLACIALQAPLDEATLNELTLMAVPFIAFQNKKLKAARLTSQPLVQIQTIHKPENSRLILLSPNEETGDEETGDGAVTRLASILAAKDSFAARTALLCLQCSPGVSSLEAPKFSAADMPKRNVFYLSDLHWRHLLETETPDRLYKPLLKCLVSSEDALEGLRMAESKLPLRRERLKLREFIAHRCKGLLEKLDDSGLLVMSTLKPLGALFLECAEHDEIPLLLSVAVRLMEQASQADGMHDASLLNILADTFEKGSHQVLSAMQDECACLQRLMAKHLVYNVATDLLSSCVESVRKCVTSLTSLRVAHPIEGLFHLTESLRSEMHQVEGSDDSRSEATQTEDKWWSARVSCLDDCMLNLAVSILEHSETLTLDKKSLARLHLLFPALRQPDVEDRFKRLSLAIKSLVQKEETPECLDSRFEETLRETASEWLDEAAFQRLSRFVSPSKAQQSCDSVANLLSRLSRLLMATKMTPQQVAAREPFLERGTQLGVCLLRTWLLRVKRSTDQVLSYTHQTLPSIGAVADALVLVGKAIILDIRQYYVNGNETQAHVMYRLCQLIYSITHALTSVPASDNIDVRRAWHDQITCKNSDYINLALTAEALVYCMPQTDERVRVDLARLLAQGVRDIRSLSLTDDFVSKGKPFMSGLRAIVKSHNLLKRRWQAEGALNDTQARDLRVYVEESIEPVLLMVSEAHHL